MTSQAEFSFDAPTQQGMKMALDNSDPRWREEVAACVRAVALRMAYFQADDIYTELERNLWHFTTHNSGALGPLIVQVMGKLHYMERSAEDPKYVRSRRPMSHGNLHRRYRSRIFQEGTRQ